MEVVSSGYYTLIYTTGVSPQNSYPPIPESTINRPHFLENLSAIGHVPYNSIGGPPIFEEINSPNISNSTSISSVHNSDFISIDPSSSDPATTLLLLKIILGVTAIYVIYFYYNKYNETIYSNESQQEFLDIGTNSLNESIKNPVSISLSVETPILEQLANNDNFYKSSLLEVWIYELNNSNLINYLNDNILWLIIILIIFIIIFQLIKVNKNLELLKMKNNKNEKI